jgi:hypothetical protein
MRGIGIEGTTYSEPPKRMSSFDFSMAEDILSCDVKRMLRICSIVVLDRVSIMTSLQASETTVRMCILLPFSRPRAPLASATLQEPRPRPNSIRALTMDFRDPSNTEESDEAILNEPYRPFYSIFGGQPILVKQYEVISKETRS